MAELAKFSGPGNDPDTTKRPACPKCGNRSVGCAWRSGLAADGVTVLEPEYMARNCGYCQFTWKEAPLDKG